MSNNENLPLHQQIKNARKAAGMTQEELANAVYVRRQQVIKWEAGVTCPSVITLAHMAHKLKTQFIIS